MKNKKINVGKELVKRTQDLNNNIESIMGKSAKPIEQSIVGENLTATISETNYYARPLNNIFLPKMKNNEYYRLILDYENPELKTFTMDLTSSIKPVSSTKFASARRFNVTTAAGT